MVVYGTFRDKPDEDYIAVFDGRKFVCAFVFRVPVLTCACVFRVCVYHCRRR